MAGEAYKVTVAAVPDASKVLKAELAPTPSPVSAEAEPPTITLLSELPPVITTFVASAVLNPTFPPPANAEEFEAVIVVVEALGTTMLKFSTPETLVRLSVEAVGEVEEVPTVTFNVSTPPAPAAML